MDKTTHAVRVQQWSEIIQAQLTSGMNKRDWCRENNIPEKRFYYWQRRVRTDLYEAGAGTLIQAGDTNHPALVELQVARRSENPVTGSFSPAAIISVGNVSVGVTENISESLLLSIGKMIRHAL